MPLRWAGYGPTTGDLADGGLGVLPTVNVVTVVVAFVAGIAGILAFETRSSCAVGVAISITTIPAAADIGLSAAYGDWSSVRGSGMQLFLNIIGLLVSATITLALMRSVTMRRGRRHRAELGLDEPPLGRPPLDDPLEAHDHLTPPSPATPTRRASSAPE